MKFINKFMTKSRSVGQSPQPNDSSSSIKATEYYHGVGLDDLSHEFAEYEEEEHRTRVVMSAMRLLNAQHELGGLDELVTDDVMYIFRGADGVLVVHEMCPRDIGKEAKKMFDAKPDLDSKYRSVKKAKCNKDGGISVRQLVVTGSHHGAHFGFGSRQAAAASQKRVANEDVHYAFRGRKICKIQFKAGGVYNGRKGMFTLLGGFPVV